MGIIQRTPNPCYSDPLSTCLSLIREGVVCVFHSVFFEYSDIANVLTLLDRRFFDRFFDRFLDHLLDPLS
jgi:hypothetical protein